MLLINNKQIYECHFEDLKELIDNPDYRESQLIEYKSAVSFMVVDKPKRSTEIAELCSDVCAFANAEGGYLFFGIKEKDGIASELLGISIDNRDRFELEIRNKLNRIQPKAPLLEFYYISIDDTRDIVVLHIIHDDYAPYIHLVDEQSYRVYKRYGNGKMVIGYTEMRKMFMQSRTLSESILSFRKNKIDNYLFDDKIDDRGFVMFHIIPQSFQDTERSLFLNERKTGLYLGAVFAGTGICNYTSIPCVDGLYYVNERSRERAYLFNNGVLEYVMPFEEYTSLSTSSRELSLNKDEIWNCISSLICGYYSDMAKLFGNQKYYACISIINGKGIVTQVNQIDEGIARLDRNRILCTPCVINMSDDDEQIADKNNLKLEYYLALGISKGPEITKIVEKIKQ